MQKDAPSSVINSGGNWKEKDVGHSGRVCPLHGMSETMVIKSMLSPQKCV